MATIMNAPKRKSRKKAEPRETREATPVVTRSPIQCPRCQSTQREQKHTKRCTWHGERLVIWRYTGCRECGKIYRLKEIIDFAPMAANQAAREVFALLSEAEVERLLPCMCRRIANAVKRSRSRVAGN